jgi:hypothetical protein
MGKEKRIAETVMLGRCAPRWQGKAFRAADFAAHEGMMQQLQYREKSRAWTTMLMPDENGVPRRVQDRIRDGLQGPFDRQALVENGAWITREIGGDEVVINVESRPVQARPRLSLVS